MFDVYMLLANQLLDIYAQLTDKVVKHQKHSPKWEVTVEQIDEKTSETIVHEFTPLLSLAETFRKLANHYERQNESPTSLTPLGEGHPFPP